MRYAFLLLAFFLVGCDSASNEPAERTYEIEYFATGTFETCTAIYFNDSGGVTTKDVAIGGTTWSEELTVTVREGGVELAGFDLNCVNLETEEDHTIEAELRIDGEAFLEATETGGNVSISLDARLTTDGTTED